jgi:hypothetical protein
MKAYIVTTGTLFGLIVVAHVLRVVEEGSHLAADPWYILLTAAAAGMSVWAWRLVRTLPR